MRFREGEFGLGFKGSSVFNIFFVTLRVGVIPESSGQPLLFLTLTEGKLEKR